MNGFYAIRVGDWKLFTNGQGAKLQGVKGKTPVLFNLAEDVYEQTDLSAQYPEKVKEMMALAKKRLAGINSNIIPLDEENAGISP